MCVLKPHFSIVKLGYAGPRGVPVFFFFFLFLLQNGEGVLTCTHNLCLEQKYQSFSNEIFIVFQLKNICILHGLVFVMLNPLQNLFFLRNKISNLLVVTTALVRVSDQA